jgi:hypothetical protein
LLPLLHYAGMNCPRKIKINLITGNLHPLSCHFKDSFVPNFQDAYVQSPSAPIKYRNIVTMLQLWQIAHKSGGRLCHKRTNLNARSLRSSSKVNPRSRRESYGDGNSGTFYAVETELHGSARQCPEDERGNVLGRPDSLLCLPDLVRPQLPLDRLNDVMLAAIQIPLPIFPYHATANSLSCGPINGDN